MAWLGWAYLFPWISEFGFINGVSRIIHWMVDDPKNHKSSHSFQIVLSPIAYLSLVDNMAYVLGLNPFIWNIPINNAFLLRATCASVPRSSSVISPSWVRVRERVR